MLKSLQFKIAAGLAVAVLAVGSVATVAMAITNQNAEEVSVGGQEESIPDVAAAGDIQEMETLPETENSEMSDQEALSVESETAEDVPTEGTETAEEPEQAAEPEYTYTDMSAAMYATQTVNVRNLPNTDGEKVGSLSTNEEIAVTGQCNETGWYRFEHNGSTAYVSNNYVSDTKIEVAASEPAYEQSASSSESSGRININELPVSQWVDMGDWFYYIPPVWNERPPFSTIDPEYMDIVNTLQARYPDRKIGWGHGGWLKQFGVSLWFVEAMPTAENRDMYDTLGYYMQFSQLPNT